MTITSYANAGVDIEKGDKIVRDIKRSVERTYSSAVLSPLGGFAGLYDLKELSQTVQHPTLVQSIDGVGTKSVIAKMAGDFSKLGQDLVSATLNDIIVLGAKPLTLLDYIAAGKLNPKFISSLIESLSQACLKDDISLIGGETAEMPDVYQNLEHDVVGVITGVVDKAKIIDGHGIKEGDVIIALRSSGLHTNGYSLARYVFFKQHQYSLDHYFDELGLTLGEALLEPHLSYNQPVQSLLNHNIDIKGMAHITGGGIKNNLSRILPFNIHAYIERSKLKAPAIFSLIQNLGQIDTDEMYKTFNMGAGFLIVVNQNDATQTLSLLNEKPEHQAMLVGEVVNGQTGVTYR